MLIDDICYRRFGIPGERICIRVKGEDTNGAYAILDLVKDSSYGSALGPPIHVHLRTACFPGLCWKDN